MEEYSSRLYRRLIRLSGLRISPRTGLKKLTLPLKLKLEITADIAMVGPDEHRNFAFSALGEFKSRDSTSLS